MTPAEFKAIRARLGCSAEAFARALGYRGTVQTLRGVTYVYETGRRHIPEAVACLAEMFGAYGIPEMFSEDGPSTVVRLTAMFKKYGIPERMKGSVHA
jgi:hypothetical protein